MIPVSQDQDPRQDYLTVLTTYERNVKFLCNCINSNNVRADANLPFSINPNVYIVCKMAVQRKFQSNGSLIPS